MAVRLRSLLIKLRQTLGIHKRKNYGTSENIKRTHKNIHNVTLIGGADGPTSLFIAKKDDSMQRKKSELIKEKCKYIVPNDHSFEELVVYITRKYEAVKVDEHSSRYLEEFRSIKSSLVLKERPDLVTTSMPEKPNNEQLSDPDFMSHFFQQIELRSNEAAEIDDNLFPIDLEQYLISLKEDGDDLELYVSLEYEFNLLSVSYQCSPSQKKAGPNLGERIQKDIYHYYGVTKEDIETQSERCRTYIHMGC